MLTRATVKNVCISTCICSPGQWPGQCTAWLSQISWSAMLLTSEQSWTFALVIGYLHSVTNPWVMLFLCANA